MTENEAIKKLSHDNTAYGGAYSEEVRKTAIKALEEVQQYRKHGITVESALDNMCDLAAAENLIEEYRAIGTVEELTHGKKYMSLAKRHGTIEQVVDKCAEYEAIGTPEQCLRNKDFLDFLADKMNPGDFETYLRLYDALKEGGVSK